MKSTLCTRLGYSLISHVAITILFGIAKSTRSFNLWRRSEDTLTLVTQREVTTDELTRSIATKLRRLTEQSRVFLKIGKIVSDAI